MSLTHARSLVQFQAEIVLFLCSFCVLHTCTRAHYFDKTVHEYVAPYCTMCVVLFPLVFVFLCCILPMPSSYVYEKLYCHPYSNHFFVVLKCQTLYLQPAIDIL